MRNRTRQPRVPPPRAGHAFAWAPAAFGLAVHSLVGGVALASAVAADFQEHRGLGAAGLGVLLATLVHKPADALTISTLMVRGGSARWFVHLVNLGFGLMIPLGVALFVTGYVGIHTRRGDVICGRSTFVLGRHISLHRAFGPSSGASIPLARPAQAVGGIARGGGA